ncbi:MAG: hypothetical protein ACFBSE_00505 [Prochloraceae cyanobacterium]
MLKLDTYFKRNFKEYAIVAKYTCNPQFKPGDRMSVLMPKTDPNLFLLLGEVEPLQAIVTNIDRQIYSCDRKNFLKELSV